MAMSAGDFGKAQINVTPMIDVLLVLIIMFLVITPLAPRGLRTSIPQPSTAATEMAPDADLVLSVHEDGSVSLNQEAVDRSDLETRLKQIFKTNTNRPVFIRGEGQVDFKQVAEVIDLAKGVGIERIGLMPGEKRP
jgi:biopolymer transport protein ExbD